eukprot:CAMPEP_0184261854 /NCGR_PEP_ID=MMETSP0977-20130417/15584_1 /TAXON_ID=483370 /ORGANISM="non described non described, Strain CCMP2097" /LENGTH=221 /DNA_ID=CAMNT_0026567531 /DNA_START=40 /DNA_END=703 /DNA_ORIENTATION=+
MRWRGSMGLHRKGCLPASWVRARGRRGQPPRFEPDDAAPWRRESRGGLGSGASGGGLAGAHFTLAAAAAVQRRRQRAAARARAASSSDAALLGAVDDSRAGRGVEARDVDVVANLLARVDPRHVADSVDYGDNARHAVAEGAVAAARVAEDDQRRRRRQLDARDNVASRHVPLLVASKAVVVQRRRLQQRAVDVVTGRFAGRRFLQRVCQRHDDEVRLEAA